MIPILSNTTALNPKEIALYELLLKLGPSTARDLVVKTKESRTNLYNILSSLKEKHLVYEKSSPRGKKTFCPEPPEKIEELIEEQERKIKKTKADFLNNLPILKQLFLTSQQRPVVRYFEGIEKFQKIYDETLTEGVKEISVIVSVYGYVKMDEYLKGYAKKRAELGIKTRIISDKIVDSAVEKNDIILNKERKYWPMPIPTEINIFGNKVALMSYRENLVGLIIEDKDFAETTQKIFNQIWNSL